MSAEDRNGEVSTDEKCTDCTTQERSFDELTKGLASATVSRRGALRMLAGALFGGVLASVPGVGWIAGNNGGAQAQNVGPGATPCAGHSQSCATQQCCEGYTCLTDQSQSTEKFCCPLQDTCGQSCCPAGAMCIDRQCVCVAGEACRSTSNPIGVCCLTETQTCCDGLCCDKATQQCANDPVTGKRVCCPKERVCGNTCLPAVCDPGKCEVCSVNPLTQAGQCVSSCAPGTVCCKGTGTGAGVCCATTNVAGETLAQCLNEPTTGAGICCPKALVCGQTCLGTACDPGKCEACDETSGTCKSVCKEAGQVCCQGKNGGAGTCCVTTANGTTVAQCFNEPTTGAGICCPVARVCGNICLATACGPNQVCCPASQSCVAACSTTSGEILVTDPDDPTKCKCVCPTGQFLCGGKCIGTCGPNQVCCPASQSCVAACTGGRVLITDPDNPTKCTCDCPAGQMGCSTAAGNICCPAGKCCGMGMSRVCCTAAQKCQSNQCVAA